MYIYINTYIYIYIYMCMYMYIYVYIYNIMYPVHPYILLISHIFRCLLTSPRLRSQALKVWKKCVEMQSSFGSSWSHDWDVLRCLDHSGFLIVVSWVFKLSNHRIIVYHCGSKSWFFVGNQMGIHVTSWRFIGNENFGWWFTGIQCWKFPN